MRNKFIEIPVMIMAVISIFVAFGSSTNVDVNTHSKELTSAIASYTLNDSSSTTVYQQQVTNGWVAKDLLNVIGNQNSTIIKNQTAAIGIQAKTNFLLGAVVVMLALVALAVIRSSDQRPERVTDSNSSSDSVDS